MSGETEEMTNDGVSVTSNLLWTDNPELEYFRSMMAERMQERAASGLDMNDSLIGDSTLNDMMDGELQMMESLDSNSLHQEAFQQLQHHGRPSPGHHASNLGASGLSRAEEDTIDNINAEDGSILAWFSRKRKERARERAEEDGTLESEPAMLDARQLHRSSRVHEPGQLHHNQPSPQGVQSQSHRRFFSTAPNPTPVKPQYAHEDNIELDASVGNPSNIRIPGFIFVTSEQPSSVQSVASVSQATKLMMPNDEIVDDDDRRRRCLLMKVIAVCLVMAVVVSGIMQTVIFTNNRTESERSSSAQGPGTTSAIPTSAPVSPKPSSITESSSPQSKAPSLVPAESALPSMIPTILTSTAPSDNVLVTMVPSVLLSPGNQNVAPSLAPTFSIAARLEELSPMSSEAWLNPDSPQSLAASWLINDSEAETYSNRRLLQRYPLATLYYSTKGERWSQSSTSWVAQRSDECVWWGIECNNAGGVEVLQLSNDNLSGSLPPEIQLLSNSLEEIYLNDNLIGGNIPSTIGLLTKLSHVQLSENSLTGSLPAALSNLSNLRNLSVKDNKLSGELPSELGALSLLRNFDVSRNDFDGTIPQSYGNMIALGSMYLFENQLTGTIPTTFSQLVDMKIFRVESNDLIGTMPSELCHLEHLRADCIEEVTCEVGCCTICCVDGESCVSVTNSPTLEPTSVIAPSLSPTESVEIPIEPTNSPTVEPTSDVTVLETEDISSIETTMPTDEISSCEATIETDRPCYERGDNIVVTFENCESTELDWIGIYPTNVDIMALGNPLAWVWACGDQFCNSIVDAGQAIFYNARGTGLFVVYLLRSSENLDGSFVAYGVGNSFAMATICA